MQLDQKYNREDFLNFIEQSFLSNFKRDVRPINTANLSNIQKAYSLGRDEGLDLQVFEFHSEGALNNRVTLTKEAFNIMKSSATFNGLAIFYSENKEDWRLSLMTANPERTEKGKVTMAYSNPRRYSYFLGPNSKINTPTKFLLNKSKVIDSNDLKGRFSIEVVNKEFYKQISEAFIKLVGGTVTKGKKKIKHEAFLKLPFIQDQSQQCLEFGVRLIGRIIFCWFLREKASKNGKSLMPKELVSFEAVKKNEDYYHKILEPIFFEVLNKPIKSRKDRYVEEPFLSIPYLNGGLFSPQYDDHFSYNGDQAINHNILIVPDKWFHEFFEILETYNFTIDENISFDEELSIDPEMLGRIFENLLAEINPETGESARKSTGSYYTPRPIVDYMVDESLMLYLQTKTNIAEEKIRAAVSYNLDDDLSCPLDEEEKERIIDALETVKILDPACGSGAFPIGALQKIVFILQQLDPEGHIWFQKQIKNTSPEIKRIIEREFKNKNFDYIRKLGIIRENIYGVDIQPIATEISRLRCFLTLIVDESVHDELENRGVEPLPNLDFKFVTANSLVELPESSEKDQMGLFEDDTGINELKRLRDMFFTAYGSEREQLKLQFVQAQNKMFQKLLNEGRAGHAALSTKLTTWDPFSHDSSLWFDQEWMFGIKDKFDIVVANPPYLKERDNKKNFEIVNESTFGKKYHQGKMDFWYYFLHKAINLVKEKGTISYITSRYWLNSRGASKLIKRVSKELSFINFLDIGKLKVFNSVAGHHMVAVYKKTKDVDKFIYKKLENNLSDITSRDDTKNLKIRILSNKDIYSENNEIVIDDSYRKLVNIIELGRICHTSIGVQESPDSISSKQFKKSKRKDISIGDGVFVLNEEEMEKLKLNKEEKKMMKKYLDPNDVGKYWINWDKKYLIYSDNLTKEKMGKEECYFNLKNHLDNFKEFISSSNKPYGLHRPRKLKYFLGPKIIFKGMFINNEFTYDIENYFVGFSFSLIIQKDRSYDLKYILAILNSKFALDWFYKKGKNRGAGVDIGVEKLRIFPVKKATIDEQKPFVEMVDKILNITSSDDYRFNAQKREIVNKFEKELDQLVYKLYGLTKEEIMTVEQTAKKLRPLK